MKSNNTAPFNRYSEYIKKTFGERIQKITIDAGFTCPNRDGTKGVGGCTFCNNESFSPATKLKSLTITEQINSSIFYLKKRYKVNKFIAYFQSYSNTYGPLNKLKQVFEEALEHPDVIGLSIGTRPDCIDKAKIEYLKELSKSFDITIELGVESLNDITLQKINRGHTAAESIAAIKLAKDHGLKVCVHLIIGLPGDEISDWLYAAQVFSDLNVDFIKVHNLEIIRNTQMENTYKLKEFELLTREKYIQSVIQFLKHLSNKIVIQRLFDESPESMRIAPHWDFSYLDNIDYLINTMKTSKSLQGDSYK